MDRVFDERDRLMKRRFTAGLLGRLAVWFMALVLAPLAAVAGADPWQSPNFMGGETLYNGITLPNPFPPNVIKMYEETPTPHYLTKPPPVIIIDIGRQLFVDNFLIENTTLKQECHLAEYYPGNPVMTPGIPFSGGVWFDPKDKLIKMWYNKMGVRYATSKDGIHWDRPALGIMKGPKPADVNMLMGGGVDTVWLDQETQDAKKRFVMFHSQPGPPNDANRMRWRFSEDGLRWSDIVKYSGSQGDRSTAFYNPFRKVWVFSRRQDWGEPRVRRYWEVKDLMAGPYWESIDLPPCWWVGADSLDPQRPEVGVPCQLYNLDAVAYESVMLGGFTIWRGHPVWRNKPNDLCVGFSRDGWSWSRPDRRPFCPISEDYGSWNWVNTQSAAGMCLIMGDRLFFLVSGRGGISTVGGQATGLFTLRRDGFCSMNAPAEGGTLVTRPVKFSGKYMFVNVEAPKGELRVEVLDEKNQVIAPFSADNCVPVKADKTLQPVGWKGGADLSSLAGKIVKFRFTLKNGKLYAFWVSPDASGASHGYVAGGGPGFTGPKDTVGSMAYSGWGGNPAPPSPAEPPPALWPVTGAFSGAVTVALSVPLFRAEEGTTIRYTTDGTEPTEASTAYTGKPLTLTKTSTVKARWFKERGLPSWVASETYTITPDTTPPHLSFGRAVPASGKPAENWPSPFGVYSQQKHHYFTPAVALPPGTAEAVVSLRTNEKSTCKYALKPGVAYEEMTGTFTADADDRVHKAPAAGLKDGSAVRWYVKAKDEFGNANKDDYEINVVVSEASAAPVRITLDAANGRLTAPMVAAEEGRVSYVSSKEEKKGSVAFTFSVPAAGDYVVWARAFGPDDNSDSFYVSVDGGVQDAFDVAEGGDAYGKYGSDTREDPKWHWAPVNGRDNRNSLSLDPRVFALARGEHTLIFGGREPKARLARIVITNERSFVGKD
jgi:hypothetical protein